MEWRYCAIETDVTGNWIDAKQLTVRHQPTPECWRQPHTAALRRTVLRQVSREIPTCFSETQEVLRGVHQASC